MAGQWFGISSGQRLAQEDAKINNFEQLMSHYIQAQRISYDGRWKIGIPNGDELVHHIISEESIVNKWTCA